MAGNFFHSVTLEDKFLSYKANKVYIFFFVNQTIYKFGIDLSNSRSLWGHPADY